MSGDFECSCGYGIEVGVDGVCGIGCVAGEPSALGVGGGRRGCSCFLFWGVFVGFVVLEG